MFITQGPIVFVLGAGKGRGVADPWYILGALRSYSCSGKLLYHAALDAATNTIANATKQ